MATNSPFSDPRLQTFHGGYIPTPPDPQQLMFPRLLSPRRAAAARVNHDLRAFHDQSMCMPIGNQRDVGSCTAWTWAYEVRGMLTARWRILNNIAPNLNDTLSPRFIYDVERGPEFEGSYPTDAGANMRSGAAVLLKYGCPPEHDLPYTDKADNGALTSEITPHVRDAAAFYGISAYFQCAGQGDQLIDSMLQVLDMGYPVATAILVPGTRTGSSFEQVPGNGRIPMPARGEGVLGGHAITIVGNFIDNSFAGGGAFVIQNHWGQWGDMSSADTVGFAYLPFAYYTTSSGSNGNWGQEGWYAT